MVGYLSGDPETKLENKTKVVKLRTYFAST